MRYRLTLLLLAGSLTGETLTQLDVTRIVSFGDSLSDMGNIDDAPVSNGPAWIDYLSRDHLGLGASVASLEEGHNYSYAGADTGQSSDDLPTPSAAQQIELFAASDGTLSANDLVTLWIGGNDFLNDADNPTPPDTLYNRYDAILRRLIGLGARNVFWGLLPDPGLLPPYINSENRPAYSAFAANVNEKIRALESEIEAEFPDVFIILFDYHTLQAEIVARPGDYGVSDPTVEIPDNADVSNAFLMPDGVHPTTKGHQIIASDAYQTILAALAGETSVHSPGIMSFEMPKSGEATLTFATETGQDYVVESSYDLSNWQPLSGTLTANSTSSTFTDPSNRPPAPKKFYRVRQSSSE